MVYDGISMHNCSPPPSVAYAYAIYSCLTFAPMFVFSPPLPVRVFLPRCRYAACDVYASPGTVRAASVLTADRSDPCSTAAVAAAAVQSWAVCPGATCQSANTGSFTVHDAFPALSGSCPALSYCPKFVCNPYVFRNIRGIRESATCRRTAQDTACKLKCKDASAAVFHLSSFALMSRHCVY